MISTLALSSIMGLMVGLAFDRFHNYDAVLLAAALGFAAAGVLVLFMGRYPAASDRVAQSAA